MHMEEVAIERDEMEYDVVIVGAGPSGLATAIRLKQLAAERGTEINVCVLEKGAEPGAHILSGAVIDPKALSELLPDWQSQGAPLTTQVTEDRVLMLTAQGSLKVPGWATPPGMQNHGNYIGSLSRLVAWLAQQAEALGVEIYPGFPAASLVLGEDGAVRGVITGDMGVEKDGSHGSDFQPGMRLLGRYTVFAEGSRGHLGRQLIERFGLDAGVDPQSYAIGLKEVWEVKPENFRPGLVVHTAGWPLDNDTYGGSFLYHYDENRVAAGFVVGLNYQNPYLSPFEEFQRWKTHPAIRGVFEGGRRLEYGARSITAGGLNALPTLNFPGGCLVGCDAGVLNAARIKGVHTAIKSGMLAAESIAAALAEGGSHDALKSYQQALHGSWVREELWRSRNFKPIMNKGLVMGSLLLGLDQTVFRGKAPFTLHVKKPDHTYLKPAADCSPIVYPKPDNTLTFDRLSSIYLSGVNHREDQPAHLTLKDAAVPVSVNLATYAGPEARYCPAGVYEFVDVGDGDAAGAGSAGDSSAAGTADAQADALTDDPAAAPQSQPPRRLVINAQNCIHCKTCDIKDPRQNIVWVAPEGGGGPAYSGT
ncbi:MAG: electron transfer flavoprotein-ubiquinone oxidoreductase [Lautropia sp.]|nr:electron transfer flavoprotein-ubiquinone oxidoreductase [Lautropia sp.]